jgi:hypothetical protein
MVQMPNLALIETKRITEPEGWQHGGANSNPSVIFFSVMDAFFSLPMSELMSPFSSQAWH